MIGSAFLLVSVLAAPAAALAALPPQNFDEAKVPPYTLPDPLAGDTGKVQNTAAWKKKRRPEILRLFETHVYGRTPTPARPPRMRFVVTSIDRGALGGQAMRKQIRVLFTGDPDGPHMDLLIYLPAQARRPVPAFLGLNFCGNHCIHPDPGIALSTGWMRDGIKGMVDHRATELSRGAQSGRWPVEKILARGYAVATAYYGDLDPDFDDGFQNGVHPLFYRARQTRPGPDEWGAIGAWAWGLSRAMDYLETDRDIDARHVALHGLSRLGKTALWAGAQDERFAIVISTDSGEGGAALAHRGYGETIKLLNTVQPHWFCANYKRYDDDPGALPVDQHMLVSLIAPRPVYVASAIEDRGADPRGEFLAAKNAEPVYRLFGKAGLGVDDMPAVDHPVGDAIGYHVRTGKHDITPYDWEQFMTFTDRHFHRRR